MNLHNQNITTLTCRNCKQQFKGKFCDNCGQSASTKRLDYHFVLHEIEHGIFHMDYGIFYTIKELFTRPGHSIREFIEGKRVKHFKPLSLVIVLAGFYALFLHYFPAEEKPTFNWFNTNFVKFQVGLIPIIAYFNYLVFKKQGYNFIEHMVLFAYTTGQSLILEIIFHPIVHVVRVNTDLQTILQILFALTSLIFSTWVYVQFFNKLRKRKVILLLFLSIIILILTISFILVAGISILTKLKN